MLVALPEQSSVHYITLAPSPSDCWCKVEETTVLLGALLFEDGRDYDVPFLRMEETTVFLFKNQFEQDGDWV